MKTIRLEEPSRLVLDADAAPPPAPGTSEAHVKIHRIGICGTDIHAFGGKQPFFTYPRVLGHELGVEVLATGPGVTNVKPGDLCAVEPYLNCGTCIACRHDKGNCCTDIRVLGVHTDGGMREEIVLPAAKLHPSAVLGCEQLALVEPLAIGAHAISRAGITQGEHVLIIGAGPIGLAAILFAVEREAIVTVLDVNDARLDFCRRHFRVSHTIHAGSENPTERLAEITAGDFPTAVIDATGNPNSMMRAFDFPAHGGRIVFVGLFQGEVTFNDPNFHKRELTLLASRNAHPEDFSRIIRLLETGRIDTAPWITHRCKFAELPENFPAFTRPESGVIKAMVEVI